MLRCADDSRNVEARLARHNSGKGARYTRSRLPVALVHVEEAAGRGAALRREREIKRLSAGEKRKLVYPA